MKTYVCIVPSSKKSNETLFNVVDCTTNKVLLSDVSINEIKAFKKSEKEKSNLIFVVMSFGINSYIISVI